MGDTLLVENLAPVIPDTLHPVEVARYGRASGAPEYLFTQIYSFAVDEEGSVFIFDERDGIRWYSREGDYEGVVAGRGEGPGEVGYVVAMSASGSGRVAVVDISNRRISVFSRGHPTWSTRLGRGHPPYREGAITFHKDDSVWIETSANYPLAGGIGHPRAVYVRLDGDGSSVDTVFTPPSAATQCPTLSSIEHAAGFWEDRRDPFVPKVKWALGPDGTFIVGCPSSYQFSIYQEDGPVLKVTRERPPVIVTPEERAFREERPVPKAEGALPAYSRLLAPDGLRIWVWPRQPNVKRALQAEAAERFGVTHSWVLPWQGAFDVFTTEGDWLAVVKLPPKARYSGYPTEPNVVIRGDTLWAVELDDFDVPTVVRYTVPGLTPERGVSVPSA